MGLDIYRDGCGIDDYLEAECKESQGGVGKLYIFPFVEYGVDDVVIVNEVIQSIPYVDIYEFDVWGASYTESASIKQGNISYQQSLNFNVPITDTYKYLFKLLKRDHFAIFIDRNSNTRIMGVWNGCEAKYSNKTGSNKSDMNGYEISLSARENNQAYWVSNIDTLFNVRPST
tara:strand:+ start:14824 stop:15342 length:519 start_codon:yes stop_codon:yes gene_type:complete